MQLTNITWYGPKLGDAPLLSELPDDLVNLLRQVNGFVQFQGALHVRGACRNPRWHSLREAWLGDSGFQRLYAEVRDSDIPFAQDCVGDQFLLRDEEVWVLDAETGDMDSREMGLEEFLKAAQHDPVEFLSMQPLMAYQAQHGTWLEPGQLLHVHPPFCSQEAEEGLTMRALPAVEVIGFHADLAARIADVPDGTRIEFTFDAPPEEDSGQGAQGQAGGA